MRVCHSTFLKETRAGTAAEFAMVLPLLLLLIFGLIDAGRYIWTYNRAEKAAQIGVRWAVATKMIPQGLYDTDFVNGGTISQGDAIPTTAFGSATCNSTGGAVSCSCDTGSTCPSLGTANDDAFTAIVNRMASFLPELTRQNVEIQYSNSGLGYAGSPNGADIAPLINIKIKNLNFTPITSMLALTIQLPDFQSGLTMEDGSGNFAD